MSSVIYASISALLITWLSMNVVYKRREHRVSIGDGDNEILATAMAAQSNAIEYIPIYLLLLFALEYNQGNVWLVHGFGVALIAGRLIHARGLLGGKLKTRVLGMQITLYTLIGLAITNLFYVPYAKFALH